MRHKVLRQSQISGFLILAMCLLPLLSATAQFDLSDGQRWPYRIDIETEKRVEMRSGDDRVSAANNIFLNSDIDLYLTILVIENYDNEYALISCVYDSLRGQLKSSVDGTITEVGVRAMRDHIRIYQNDTLVSEFTPGFMSGEQAADFYEQLIFIGEDIRMLVYPTGEIINITENKNLWQMAQEFSGGLGDGFLQVVFPENIAAGSGPGWEQAIARNQFGGFELKQRFEPLLLQYRMATGGSFNIRGSLAVDSFYSEVSTPELADELTLIVNDYSTEVEANGKYLRNPGVVEAITAAIIESAEYRLIISGTSAAILFSSQYQRKDISYTLLPR